MKSKWQAVCRTPAAYSASFHHNEWAEWPWAIELAVIDFGACGNLLNASSIRERGHALQRRTRARYRMHSSSVFRYSPISMSRSEQGSIRSPSSLKLPSHSISSLSDQVDEYCRIFSSGMRSK